MDTGLEMREDTTPGQRLVTEAYDRWSDAIAAKMSHADVNRRWESFLQLKDSARVCGHHDPFGGPCLLPAALGQHRTHDDKRVRR